MKNLVLTFVMFLFVGVTATMAQDKKADADHSATVKTEVSAEKHACEPGCTKACCAAAGDKAAGDKKACAPSCEKKCPAHAAATEVKEEHVNP
ncbi:MAG: hypothetical protein K9J17_02835 [Flavobacteriales bacterium]|nr:hypothetical protein [Flavobacteriales bacterium]